MTFEMPTAQGLSRLRARVIFEMILRKTGVVESFEIALRTTDILQDYLDQRRASWLIKI
jgi:hypothetical protein